MKRIFLFVLTNVLVVAVLARLGMVRAAQLTQYWRHCILGSFVLGAVISPGNDVPSMLVFTCLLLGVYILSVVMALAFYKKKDTHVERR